MMLYVFLACTVGLKLSAAFDLGIEATKCNLDPFKGDLNDPCESLYDAACKGSNCICPLGTHEDKNLKRCVPGTSPTRGDDTFDDLPLDYVPGKGSEERNKSRPSYPRTEKPDDGTQFYERNNTNHNFNQSGVLETKCNKDPVRGTVHDPCMSLYGAVCDETHCKCPYGTHEDKNMNKCVQGFPSVRGGDNMHPNLTHDSMPANKNEPNRPDPHGPRTERPGASSHSKNQSPQPNTPILPVGLISSITIVFVIVNERF